ncbi:MAG TPA: thioredoxin [Telluria sp.]
MSISLKTRPARAAALIAGLLLAAQAAAAPSLPPATDLGRDGRTALARGVPIVILFSLPDCTYCAVVRRNYLVPLAQEGDPRSRPLVRELELNASAPLRGFGNEATSGKALAERYQIKVAPTVVMLDSDGNLAAPPLAGGDVSGMYGAYLDAALVEARSAVDTARGKKKNGTNRRIHD